MQYQTEQPQSNYARTRRTLLPLALLFGLVAALLCLPFAGCADGTIRNGDTSHPIVLFASDTTTGQAGVTGLTLTVTISKNGAAFAAPTGTVTEIGSGFYAYTPSAADDGTNGELIVNATGTGAYVNPERRRVESVNRDDGARFGLTSLPAAAPGTVGGLQVPIVASGTSPGGNTATTFALATGASATSGLYVGNVLRIIGGTGAGQSRVITGYNGATFTSTLSRPWIVAPDATSVYSLVDDPHAALDPNLAVTTGTNSDKAGYTVSTVQDKTGYGLAAGQSVTASNLPAFPANFNLLSVSGTGAVTTSNPATGGSTVTEASIWGYGTRTLTAQADTPGTTTILGNYARRSDIPAALTDYQQRAVAVTLPATPPTGYGGGTSGDTPGTTTLLSRIPGIVQPQTGDGYAQGVANAAVLAALPSVATFLSGMKTDPVLSRTFSRSHGAYTYNLTTHVMTLLYDDGTTMATVTLTSDPATGTITGKQ